MLSMQVERITTGDKLIYWWPYVFLVFENIHMINELNAILGQVIPMQTMRSEQMKAKLPAVISKLEQEIVEARQFSS